MKRIMDLSRMPDSIESGHLPTHGCYNVTTAGQVENSRRDEEDADEFP